MHRALTFLLPMLAVALGTAQSFSQEKAEPRGANLNYILFHIDDLGWTDLGCYGSEFYETPNIDKLASEGMRFTDAYAACAVCSPTRAAILTGRYPGRLGVTDWIRSGFQGGKIPEDNVNPSESTWVGGKGRKMLCPANALWMESEEVTIAEMLKKKNYVSCHIGKWHLGAEDWYPDKQGFDFNIGGCDYGQPPNYFDPYFKEKQGDIPTLKPRKEGEYLTDREADEAASFITAHKDKPFFLYCAPYAVHTPIQAKKDLVEKYQKKPKTHQKHAAYAAMIESVDDLVGRVMATLEEAGIAGKTAVLFTSDNGGLLASGITSNKPLRSGKGYSYEGGIRVPLIVKWPGLTKAGSVCDLPVMSIDYLPTILHAEEINPPLGRTIDGMSILSYLKDPKFAQSRDALVWHFPHYRGKDVTPYSIIRSGEFKLIKRYDGKPFELFNLKEDIGETKDLSGEKADVVKELDAKLVQMLGKMGAKIPKPNEAYEG